MLGHQLDGWPLCATLRARPEISLVSNSVRTLKRPSDETEVPSVHTHANKNTQHVQDPVVHVIVRWIVETPK